MPDDPVPTKPSAAAGEPPAGGARPRRRRGGDAPSRSPAAGTEPSSAPAPPPRTARGSRRRQPAATPLILVTGGTGILGRRVVARLQEAGRAVRVLSRGRHEPEEGVTYVVGDLVANTGVLEALDGVRTIVHCAGTAKFDAIATRHLVEAASSLDPRPHLVCISVVGVDRVDSSYLRTKLEAERVVRNSGLPWTILRSTQFFDLVLTSTQRAARFPVIPALSGFITQPVDADEVAERLVELALGDPAERVPDIGGPQVLTAAALIRVYLRKANRRRLVLPLWLPGLGRIRAGGLLVRTRKKRPGDEAREEPARPRQRTWEEFLEARL